MSEMMVKKTVLAVNKARVELAGRWLPVLLPGVGLLSALALGTVIGVQGEMLSFMVAGGLLFVLLVALGQYELLATLILVVHIYMDWYLDFQVVAPGLVLVLLALFFLMRSPEWPQAAPRWRWLWALLLLAAIPPAIRGAQGLHDLAFYYPNMIFGALLFFWLGLSLARSPRRLRTLFKLLAALGALLALHTILVARTGIFILYSSRFDEYLNRVSNFTLADSTANRFGGLMINPDWNGALFAMLLYLPLGLFVESSTLLAKLLYLAEMILLLLALLYTYSSGAWLAAGVGLLVFLVFSSSTLYRVLISCLLLGAIALIFVLFPREVGLQLAHASNSASLLLRIGAWETALRVIAAFPLSGVGLGLTTYMQVSDVYRVPLQYHPLAHPHNSYLELAALGGLPVALSFITLLLLALRQVCSNWIVLEPRTRALLAGGLASLIALSVNSLSVNAWTLPPLAAIGWLITGACASPLLVKSLVKPAAASAVH